MFSKVVVRKKDKKWADVVYRRGFKPFAHYAVLTKTVLIEQKFKRVILKAKKCWSGVLFKLRDNSPPKVFIGFAERSLCLSTLFSIKPEVRYFAAQFTGLT